MSLFLERGFDQVSVAEVARAADVSEATVFNYFTTKEDLVYDRMDAFEQELLAAVRERPAGETPLRAFARFVLDRSDRAATGDGRRRVAALTRLTSASPSLKARERQIVAEYTEALAAVLAEENGAPRRHRAPHRGGGDDGLPSLADRLRPPASALTEKRRRFRLRDSHSRQTRASSARGPPRRLRQDTLKSGVQRNETPNGEEVATHERQKLGKSSACRLPTVRTKKPRFRGFSSSGGRI